MPRRQPVPRQMRGVEMRLHRLTRERLRSCSRRSLAERARVPYPTLDHWLRLEVRLSFDQAIRLAGVVGSRVQLHAAPPSARRGDRQRR